MIQKPSKLHPTVLALALSATWLAAGCNSLQTVSDKIHEATTAVNETVSDVEAKTDETVAEMESTQDSIDETVANVEDAAKPLEASTSDG